MVQGLKKSIDLATNQTTKKTSILEIFTDLNCKYLKPGSHMSPMIGESFSVTLQGENSQRILLMSSHKQWSSPISATYENQALSVHAC